MKIRALFTPLLAVLLAPVAFAATVNFDTAGDLTNNFNTSVAVGGTATNGFSESPGSGGITGSPGSVAYNPVTTNDVSSVYKQQSFAFTSDGVTLTESFSFHLGTATPTAATRVLQLGFMTANNSTFNANNQQPVAAAFTSLRINTVASSANSFTIELQDKIVGVAGTGANAVAGTQTITLIPGDWYTLTLTLTNTAGTDSYSLGGTVQDFGTTGNTAGSIITFAPLTRTLVGIDATLSGGFRATGVNNTTNYDSFAVSVPEPATLALTLLSSLGLVALRRRR